MTSLPHIEKKWVFPEECLIPESLSNLLPLPDLVHETLVRRGFTDPDSTISFLDFKKYQPTPGFQLPDLEKGVERVNQAIENGQMIGVWGDFDVDGQTSTALLVSALRKLNIDPKYHIPIRANESHGIGLENLKNFLGQGINLLITCDTGITAHESISYAQSRGIDVIVTDHHVVPDQLPPAYAVVNPRRLPPSHPLSYLPGVGTAYKFVEALLSSRGLVSETVELHDLVALGSIADLAELKADTRFLVQSGLDRMRTTPRAALLAMMEANDIKPEGITEELVSFVIAPRLNAIGRLADANPMVEFLLSTKSDFLSVTVNQLEGLNAQRKLLCNQVLAGAISQIENDATLLDDPVLVLAHPEWPAGVVGIAASRLVEIFHRPVLLLVSPHGLELRGSARSIEGIDITQAIRSCSEYLLSFGGHPMAAGLALNSENFVPFKKKLIRFIKDTKIDVFENQTLTIDIVRQLSDLSLGDVESLDAMAPFGPGNPSLVFSSRQMHISEITPVGKDREHLQVLVEDTAGNLSKLIWWNGQGLPVPEGGFDLAYSARSSNFRGQKQVQFEWIDYKENREEILLNASLKKRSIDLVDLRGSGTLLSEISDLISSLDAVVWKEGTDATDFTGVNRYALRESPNLVLWTPPPNLEVLKLILTLVKPEKVYWCQIPAYEHKIPGFLRSLARLIKNGIDKGQFESSLRELSTSTATTEEMVILGIRWLAASGKISFQVHKDGAVSIQLGGTVNVRESTVLKASLMKVFGELDAFHNYLSRISLVTLLNELG